MYPASNLDELVKDIKGAWKESGAQSDTVEVCATGVRSNLHKKKLEEQGIRYAQRILPHLIFGCSEVHPDQLNERIKLKMYFSTDQFCLESILPICCALKRSRCIWRLDKTCGVGPPRRANTHSPTFVAPPPPHRQRTRQHVIALACQVPPQPI